MEDLSEGLMFSVGQTATRLGVHPCTIRRWEKKGLLRCLRTPGNHRRITPSEIDRLLEGQCEKSGVRIPPTKTKACAIYVRVSGHRQKTDGDLSRQVERLTDLCMQTTNTHPQVFTDIGSGLNMRRRGLKRLFTAARKGTIGTVFVTTKDRLARFGVELIERMLSDYGVTLHVLLGDDEKTPQEELVADLMALIASFSGRVYGLRAATLKHIQQQSSSP
jgi:putative resolvase